MAYYCLHSVCHLQNLHRRPFTFPPSFILSPNTHTRTRTHTCTHTYTHTHTHTHTYTHTHTQGECSQFFQFIMYKHTHTHCVSNSQTVKQWVCSLAPLVHSVHTYNIIPSPYMYITHTSFVKQADNGLKCINNRKLCPLVSCLIDGNYSWKRMMLILSKIWVRVDRIKFLLCKHFDCVFSPLL